MKRTENEGVVVCSLDSGVLLFAFAIMLRLKVAEIYRWQLIKLDLYKTVAIIVNNSSVSLVCHLFVLAPCHLKFSPFRLGLLGAAVPNANSYPVSVGGSTSFPAGSLGCLRVPGFCHLSSAHDLSSHQPTSYFASPVQSRRRTREVEGSRKLLRRKGKQERIRIFEIIGQSTTPNKPVSFFCLLVLVALLQVPNLRCSGPVGLGNLQKGGTSTARERHPSCDNTISFAILRLRSSSSQLYRFWQWYRDCMHPAACADAGHATPSLLILELPGRRNNIQQHLSPMFRFHGCATSFSICQRRRWRNGCKMIASGLMNQRIDVGRLYGNGPRRRAHLLRAVLMMGKNRLTS